MSAMYGQSPPPQVPNAPSSPTASSEKSIKSCYAVVYELQNRKWAVSGEGGWSEVHLCHDSHDNSHRILAWTVKNQNVLMNCNVTAECSYKEKSKNFHSFTDENKNRFGLGFHKSDSGLRQALHFLNATQGVIKECKNSDLGQFSLGNNNSGGYGGSGPPPNPYQSQKGSYSSGYQNHQSKPLPPSPNNNSQNYQQNNNNNINSYSNNNNNYNSYNNSNNNNNSQSGGGMPKPPAFMSSLSSEKNNTESNNNVNVNNNSYNNNNNNKQAKSPPSVPSHNNYNSNSSNGHVGKSPPPNPYSPQYKSSGNGQGQGAPPPAFSSYSSPQQQQPQPPKVHSPRQQGGQQAKPPPSPPPSMSQAASGNGNGNGNNYPQLQKPQSTTENVKLSPVQAAVNHDNEQKQQQHGYGQGQQGPKSPMAEANLPNYHLDNKQTKSLPSQPIGGVGSLKVFPPKPKKLQSGDKKILNPDQVELKVRVVHNKDTGEYHGLPKEWMEELNKQFGVKPHMLPSVKLNSYSHKIPKVLVTLRQKLEDANAYEQMGIFRLAPNATANDAMKATINKGKFDGGSDDVDSNVYANLIKVWFRDLPDPLLNCVDPVKIEMAQKENDVAQIVSQFPEPQKSIFEWLCDMCVECAKHEKVNKMGPQNLAIVIGPNLFNTDNFENPMKAMTFSGKVVQFFKLAIVNRQNQLQG